MKKVLFLFALFLSSCLTPQNPEAWMESKVNACVPTAIAFREGLKKYGVWSEVLIARWITEQGKPNGHAYVAYLYPSGENKLWTYDALGSWRTRAYTNSPVSVALAANKLRGYATTKITAEYLK